MKTGKRDANNDDVNALIRSMLQGAPVGLLLLRGPQFVVELANEKYRAIVDRTEEQLIGSPLLEVIPEVRTSVEPILREVYKTGQPFFTKEFEAAVNRYGKREPGFFEFVFQPQFDGDGNVTAILNIVIEITEAVISRKKLIESEERLRLAVEAGELGTYEVDLATNHTITSKKFHEIFRTDEKSRDRFVSTIHPDDIPIRARAYEVAKESGILEYEVRLVHADGSIAWMRAKGKYLYDESGKPVTLLGTVQDITKEKNFADELARQVDERTEELQAANEEIRATNEELEESNGDLVKANIELEQFTYAASHDLQEPLRKIRTFASMLMENSEGLSSKQQDHLGKVIAASERMKAVMNDLLFYSQQIRDERELVNTDLNDIMKAVLSDLELTIEQKQAKIEIGELPSIEGIPGQMHQLFINLVSNSLKFSNQNVPPHIVIKATPLSDGIKVRRGHLDPNKDYVNISVSDNGIGFKPEFADYVFQLFKRLNRNTEYSGTGIGLALCKRIVENHNGDIYAESKPGEGTIMNVIFRA